MKHEKNTGDFQTIFFFEQNECIDIPVVILICYTRVLDENKNKYDKPKNDLKCAIQGEFSQYKIDSNKLKAYH